MKIFVKYALALALLVAAGTAFVSKSREGSLRLPAFVERAAPGKLVESSGRVLSERRVLEDFGRVELSGSGTVVVRLGDENAVTVTADGAALPYVETELRDGALRLNLKPGIRVPGAPVRYEVTAKRLSAVKTSGSGSITIETPLSGEKIELRSEGSGDIVAVVDAEEADVVIAGSGDVRLGGRAAELDLAILGSGGVSAAGLSGASADVKVMGSGGVELGAFQEIEANIAGSGDVVYAGNPRVSSRVLGTGKLRSK